MANAWAERDIGLQADHTNVVRTWESFATVRALFLVQELVEGGTLAEHLHLARRL